MSRSHLALKTTIPRSHTTLTLPQNKGLYSCWVLTTDRRWINWHAWILERFEPDAIVNSWRPAYIKIELRTMNGTLKELVRRGLPFTLAFGGQFLSMYSVFGAILTAFNIIMYLLLFSSDYSPNWGKTQKVCSQSMSRSLLWIKLPGPNIASRALRIRPLECSKA